MITREFQLTEGTSDKFWKITLEGKQHTVQFGRRGTSGQTQQKEFGSEDEARKAYDKLVAEKVKKGYLEIAGAAATPAAAASPVAVKAPKKAPAPARAKLEAEKPEAEKPDAEKLEAEKPTPAPLGPAPASAAPVAPASAPAAPFVPVASASAVPVAPAPQAIAERKIDLTPAEWMLATWRKTDPLPLPAPRPFDPGACAATLEKLDFTGWRADWSALDLPVAMTRAEAHFWFDAVTSVEKGSKLPAVAAKLAKEKHDGKVTLREVEKALNSANGEALALPLRNLFDVEQLGELFTSTTFMGRGDAGNELIAGLRTFWVPYASGAEKKALARKLVPLVDVSRWPSDYYLGTPLFQLAAALGMHDELLAVVESWPEQSYGKDEWNDHYHQPQMVIFGLGSAELVEKHFRRQKLRTKTPIHLAGWLAHTEATALDVVEASILTETNKENAQALMDVFTRVHAPEAASPMLALHLGSKAPKAARQWLDDNPLHAVAGLVPAASVRGKLGDAAIEALRALKKKGYAAAIARAAAGSDRVRKEVVDFTEATYEPFDAKSTPAWLAKGLESAPAQKKAAGWVSAADLPPLVAGGRRLSDAQATRVLDALRAASLEERPQLLADLKAHGDAHSLDAFGWKLFERWLSEGAPSKEKWAMTALGFLGGDRSVLQLAPMIRAWPGESQHARAVNGLEVLRAIGSDTALMQLNGISQKLKFQGLKTKAREMMEAIAKDMGLSRADLEDRVVPDCDLDERGRREFDFGPRRFHFALGPGLKPMIRDESGKLRDNLPDPNAKDDAAKAEAATEEWKLAKKQIKEVAKIQAERLEQAMVTGRRWKAADFEALILRHPLMTNLARLLVWGAFGPKGKLTGCFRVTEEQDLADANDEPYALAKDAQVGVVHALQLDEATSAAWGQVLADYEILQPFPQLGRPVFRVEGKEAKQTSIERLNGKKLPAPSLVFTLEKLGWRRGTPMDAGCFDEHSRQFPAAGITAVVTYEGTVSMGYIQPEEDLTITGCCFVRGLKEPSGYERYTKKDTLALGDVDPVVLSETLHDLDVLASKAR